MPVLTLRAADLRPHQRRPNCTILVQLDPVLEVAPGPVDDLSATFGLDLTVSL